MSDATRFYWELAQRDKDAAKIWIKENQKHAADDPHISLPEYGFYRRKRIGYKQKNKSPYYPVAFYLVDGVWWMKVVHSRPTNDLHDISGMWFKAHPNAIPYPAYTFALEHDRWEDDPVVVEKITAPAVDVTKIPSMF